MVKNGIAHFVSIIVKVSSEVGGVPSDGVDREAQRR